MKQVNKNGFVQKIATINETTVKIRYKSLIINWLTVKIQVHRKEVQH